HTGTAPGHAFQHFAAADAVLMIEFIHRELLSATPPLFQLRLARARLVESRIYSRTAKNLGSLKPCPQAPFRAFANLWSRPTRVRKPGRTDRALVQLKIRLLQLALRRFAGAMLRVLENGGRAGSKSRSRNESEGESNNCHEFCHSTSPSLSAPVAV